MTAPFFISGEGRSGTTLLTVILNQHSEISSGPELHFRGPRNLGPDIIKAIQMSRDNPQLNSSDLRPGSWQKAAFQFVKRVKRMGLEPDFLETVTKNFLQSQNTKIASFDERFALVSNLLSEVALRVDASVAGIKVMRDITIFSEYLKNSPESIFVHIVRDGRDVLASQVIDHPSWGYKTPAQAGSMWAKTCDIAVNRIPSKNVYLLRYEDLVIDPRKTLEPLLGVLGFSWENSLLRHHEPIKIQAVSFGHASASQVHQPVNSNAIGRHKLELGAEEVQEFVNEARPFLEHFRYL